MDTAKVTRGGQSVMLQQVEGIMQKVCGCQPQLAKRH
jgi:hypothetical protein